MKSIHFILNKSFFFVVGVLTTPILLIMISCGGSGNLPLPLQTPIIESQPKSLNLEIGQPANFSISVSGTAPISYQWYWNDSPILGANTAFFSPTSATTPADNGSIFYATATNAFGKSTSLPGILNVSPSPRAPRVGDLRFKDVDAFPFVLQGIEHLTFPANIEVTWHNALGTPLDLGQNAPILSGSTFRESSWGVGVSYLPLGVPGRDFSCKGGDLINLESDLERATGPNTVITSIDIDSGQGTYAATWVTTSQPGIYSGNRQSVQPSALQDIATQAGAQGRVITGISFNAGHVYFVAYAWDLDPSTVYDVKVATVSIDKIGTAATNLVTEGFIITAVGGNYSDGFLLVGTKVHGDAIPRPIQVINTALLGRGYAPIVSILDASSSDPILWSRIWIGQQ